MQRTLNYTGRNKVERKQAIFSFSDADSNPPEFNVVFSLNSEEYPENASLYVEAYYKETRQRFNFGSVAKITPPANRRLEEIDLSGPTFFRVLIVDESGRHGLLLGSGEHFRADEEEDKDRSSILTVKKCPLGQLTWKLYFENGSAPELYLNTSIPNAIEKMRTDPVFQALILPAALREVLIYYFWNDDDEEGNEHFERWMGFASMFAEGKPENTQCPSDVIDWVDEVVTSFSERFHLADMLVNANIGDE